MKDKLVSIETAKRLKQLGFDWQCRYSYDLIKGGEYTNGVYNTNSEVETLNRINTPELWQVQKWIREEHNIHIQVEFSDEQNNQYGSFVYKNGVDRVQHELDMLELEDLCIYYKYATYEQALEEGLIKSLELIKIN